MAISLRYVQNARKLHIKAFQKVNVKKLTVYFQFCKHAKNVHSGNTFWNPALTRKIQFEHRTEKNFQRGLVSTDADGHDDEQEEKRDLSERDYAKNVHIETRFGLHYQDSLNYRIAHWDARDFEDKLFDFLCEDNGKISISKFKKVLTSTGLRDTDPRLKECMKKFADIQSGESFDSSIPEFLSRQQFKECLANNIVLISKAFKSQFVIPEFGEFKGCIDKLYRNAHSNIRGSVASYIPQLARYSPDYWSVSVCTVDGQRHSIGNSKIPFCLQSVSKPLTYAMVHSDNGSDFTHEYVGHEPSGLSFNTIALDRNNKPHNPLINAGAIVTCSLLKPEMNSADRFDYTINMIRRMAGGEHVSFNNAVYLSEKETADRNFALGYYLRENKCFPEGTNMVETMNFYFQLCSVEVTCDSGSVLAATLANGGFCPITGDKVLSSQSVRDTLTLMHSCGMYDYSGEFAFKVGLPAKSGVSGAIFLVIPNVMGICMWSPPLDTWGNSCRGIQFCQDFVQMFNFHNFDNVKHSTTKNDPRVRTSDALSASVVSLLFSAFRGDVTALRRYALQDVDMNLQDYDGRTALHLAASEGHVDVTAFLIYKCNVDPFIKDRWNNTALDEAQRFKFTEVAEMLETYMDRLQEENLEME